MFFFIKFCDFGENVSPNKAWEYRKPFVIEPMTRFELTA